MGVDSGDESVVDIFLAVIRRINPHAILSKDIRSYMEKDLTEKILHNGVSKNKFKEVLKWCASREDFKPGLLSDKPHWYIIKNWNALSHNYHQNNVYKGD